MKFDSIPPRPHSELYQKFVLIVSFILILFIPCYFMSVGVGTVFEKETFIYRVAIGASTIFCLTVAINAVQSLEKKYMSQVYAWKDYWCAYWQRVNELEDQLINLPEDASEYEVKRLKNELSYMRGIEKQADLLYPDGRTSSKRVSSPDSFVRSKFFILFAVIIVAVFLFVCVILPRLDLSGAPSTSPDGSAAPVLNVSSQSSILQYYQYYYPQTWGYIAKYSGDPFNYLEYYHSVWGRLQEYHGDGIVFDTLTSYEQTLVSYPPIGSYIYLVSGGVTYHSTPDCYTLLRSEVHSESSTRCKYYEPCSTCVGD